jgi:isocitrate dehydrogenase (NAD+)
MDNTITERAKAHFNEIVVEQLDRVERMKEPVEWIDYSQVKPIIIGILGGDGIGPFIASESRKIMEFLLKEEIENGKIEIRVIEGLTIENRSAHNKSIPDDVLEEIKKCHSVWPLNMQKRTTSTKSR